MPYRACLFMVSKIHSVSSGDSFGVFELIKRYSNPKKIEIIYQTVKIMVKTVYEIYLHILSNK